MNKKEEIEDMVSKIMKVEKESMKKRFDTASLLGDKFSKSKADTDAVNKIIELLDGGEN